MSAYITVAKSFVVLASRGAVQPSVTSTLGECLHYCNNVIVYLLCEHREELVSQVLPVNLVSAYATVTKSLYIICCASMCGAIAMLCITAVGFAFVCVCSSTSNVAIVVTYDIKLASLCRGTIIL